jgi:hypothetical protein
MASELHSILAAIRDEGNITKAAKSLGVSRRTLQNRMRHYSLPEGKRGRRKKKISYRKKHMAYTAAGLAVMGVALGTSALLIRRSRPT